MPELVFSSSFNHSGFSRFLIPSCYSIAVPCSPFAAALCFDQLVPVLFFPPPRLSLDQFQLPLTISVLMEAGGAVVCVAFVHIFLCSAPGTAVQARTVHHRIMSQPAVRARTDCGQESNRARATSSAAVEMKRWSR